MSVVGIYMKYFKKGFDGFLRGAGYDPYVEQLQFNPLVVADGDPVNDPDRLYDPALSIWSPISKTHITANFQVDDFALNVGDEETRRPIPVPMVAPPPGYRNMRLEASLQIWLHQAAFGNIRYPDAPGDIEWSPTAYLAMYADQFFSWGTGQIFIPEDAPENTPTNYGCDVMSRPLTMNRQEMDGNGDGVPEFFGWHMSWVVDLVARLPRDHADAEEQAFGTYPITLKDYRFYVDNSDPRELWLSGDYDG